MDKATHLGFKVPTGTWMVAMKIDNEDIWQKVKAGKVRGFSIEGFFTEKLKEQGNETPTENLESQRKPSIRESLTHFIEALID